LSAIVAKHPTQSFSARYITGSTTNFGARVASGAMQSVSVSSYFPGGILELIEGTFSGTNT